MDVSSDQIVFVLVVAMRLIVPLAIPRYPLPGIIAALALDGLDQTVFQSFTHLGLNEYQEYDKALDVYYLTIAYLSTLRNWDNLTALNIGRFLVYYRLAGVMLFEFTGMRASLVIFPNTFEYFFIFYEAVRLRWDPMRLRLPHLIGATAAISVFIKLPQEYWLHIARLDTTDEIAAHPDSVPLIAVLVAGLCVTTWWIVTRLLPAPEMRSSLLVEGSAMDGTPHRAVLDRESRKLFDVALVEKVVMISVVSVIFSQILPKVEPTPLQLSLAITVLVVSNTAVSEWMVRRGVGWTTTMQQFGAMGTINTGLAVGFTLLLPVGNGFLYLGDTLFLLLLVTLLITLYDRFRPAYVARLAREQQPTVAAPAPHRA